jgi:alpha-D-ribose 1-methylphosphonate 5-triphosphate diphosphatase
MDHTPGQRQFRDIDKYYTYATRGGRGVVVAGERDAPLPGEIDEGRAVDRVEGPSVADTPSG